MKQLHIISSEGDQHMQDMANFKVHKDILLYNTLKSINPFEGYTFDRAIIRSFKMMLIRFGQIQKYGI